AEETGEGHRVHGEGQRDAGGDRRLARRAAAGPGRSDAVAPGSCGPETRGTRHWTVLRSRPACARRGGRERCEPRMTAESAVLSHAASTDSTRAVTAAAYALL